MQIKLFVNSARDLKHVNWRSGRLQPYAVIWIDSGGKCSTNVDANNGVNPVWNEMFTIPVPSKSQPETAILYIDIIHAETKQVIGLTTLPLQVILDEALSKVKASFSLILERPSGRPQGSLEIQIEINDSNITNRREPYGYGQQVRNASQQPRSQPQPRTQYLPQKMNQYPNMHMPASAMLRYPTNSPQNLRPALVQQRGNVMFMPSVRPQYRPIFPQPPRGAIFNRLILDAARNQAENMIMQSFQPMQPVAPFQGGQDNMGMVNDTGVLDNSTYGGQDNMGMVNDTGLLGNSTNGASDYAGAGSSVDEQFGTDGAFGTGGVDFGGLPYDGLDMGMFDNSSGLDLGGFDASAWM